MSLNGKESPVLDGLQESSEFFLVGDKFGWIKHVKMIYVVK
jgi:hypothetical protein